MLDVCFALVNARSMQIYSNTLDSVLNSHLAYLNSAILKNTAITPVAKLPRCVMILNVQETWPNRM